MNRFLSGLYAFIMIFTVSVSAHAEIETFPGLRILSPPIWMQPDILFDNENVPKAQDTVMRSEMEMGFTEAYSDGTKYTNRVDGYTITIPSSMTVDMSYSDICTTFEDEHRRLRIFKETFNTASERLSYLNYSNKFLENTTNHTLLKKENYIVGKTEYHILEYTRTPLKKVADDKNYYACVDVCIGARVYTFFFTSDVPFTECGGYMEIVNSLATFDPSVPIFNAYNKGYKKSGISHLNAAAQKTYNKFFLDSSPFSLGMFAPEKYGGFDKLEEFEETINHSIDVFLIYTEFTDKDKSKDYTTALNSYMKKIQAYFDYSRKSGKTIELTLQTPLSRKNSSSNMVYDILNGEFDQFLEAYSALIVRNSDIPVLFRPFNEMNGDWCNYSAFHTSRDTQVYVELYKYIYNFFKKAGCDNLIWVWNPNERSFPDFKWNSELLYYPGDDYVDVYGITGYNNGTYYEGETWRTFDEIYSPIYQRAERINKKPIMITEFSCSSVGGDKVAWIEDMFLSLPRYDKIKLAVWWHAADFNGDLISRPYFMDTPDGTLDIFRKYLTQQN